MEIVYIYDIVATFSIDICAELFNIDVLWCTLHHDNYDALDDRQSCEEYNKGEQVCTKRVSHPHAGEEIDNGGSNNYTDAHQHIAENMKESSIDVDVALGSVVVGVVVSVAVAVVVTVIVTVIMSVVVGVVVFVIVFVIVSVGVSVGVLSLVTLFVIE